MSFIDNIRNEIKSTHIIGAYHRDSNRGYFDDLRGAAGERLEGFDGKAIDQKVYVSRTDLKEDEFYEFEWSVEGTSETDYSYICSGAIQEVQKAKMLQKRLDEKMEQRGTVRKDANQNQEMINREVTGAPHTYIYELLQNSNDYPCKDINKNKIPVEVQFILTKHYLFFIHSGAPFNLRNIAAICTVNEGEKRDNTETIGYKGMGFKSVFVNNDYVYLHSGGWSLRFDEKEINKPGGYKRNWQYMPIPTNHSELDNEVKSVLSSIPRNMNVFFALRHKYDASTNIPNLDKVFSDDQILVFIPNVDHVEVIINGASTYDVFKDRDRWIIKDDLTIPVDKSYKQILEESKKGAGSNNKIPEKFEKIEKISISFAVKREGNRILPIADSKIYNYLPTEQPLYVPFLLNADFVPDASRKAIPDLEWNMKLLEDAGAQFAEWWASLLTDSSDYDLTSIFDILPDFQNGDKYRDAFMKGYEARMATIPCIPTVINGEKIIVPINEIIADNTGFIVSETPVMSDEAFYHLTGYDKRQEYLPHPEVRLHPKLKSLLWHYAVKGNIGRRVENVDDIVPITRASGFDNWMTNEENAIAFYRFLFNKQWMSRMLDRNSRIFLTEDMKIATPNTIYFDIDEALQNLYMFQDLLPRLKASVRDALLSDFKGIGIFKRFSPIAEATAITANFDKVGYNYASRIQNIDDSICFLQFLASAKEGASSYSGGIPKTMPLYLQDGTVITGTTDLYRENNLGDLLVGQCWVKDAWVNFINDAYAQYSDDLNNFLIRCKIHNITAATIWNEFIAKETRIDSIISAIASKSENIAFYRFLNSVKVQGFSDTESKDLKNKYHIWANDRDANRALPLSHVLYNGKSKERDQLLELPWLSDECCWAIDKEYFYDYGNEADDEMMTFFKKNGIIEEFSVSGWIKKSLAKGEWTTILEGINTQELSQSLWEFLFENRLTAKETIGIHKFRQIPLALHDEDEMLPLDEIASNETVYQPCADLDELRAESWFPEYELTSVSNDYADLFDGEERRRFFEEIGIGRFDLEEYVEDEILDNLEYYTDFSEYENPLEISVDFHRFFALFNGGFKPDAYEKLKQTPVYTIRPKTTDEAEGSDCQSVATGFLLPSDRLNYIVELDIVPAEVLHTIRSEYFAQDRESMEVYFKDKLGNRQMEDNEIVKHLLANKDAIISHIDNKDRNIRFWQWAAQSSTTYEERKQFKNFPMFDTEGELKLPHELYVSATYSKDKEAESVIRRFIPEANFLSEAYANVEEDIDWLKLFRNISIGITAEYVLKEKVLRNLSAYKTRNDDVVVALAGIFDAIKREWEDRQEEVERFLSNLHVRCYDGQYRKVCNVLISGEYMGVDCGKYQDVVLPIQLTEEYFDEAGENTDLRANIRKFIQFLEGKVASTFIKNAQELTAKKANYFLANQSHYKDSDAHYRLIGELAEDSYAKASWVADAMKNVKLHLYNSEGQYVDMSVGKMYLGSVYNPVCDFQAYGVDTKYVSDEYRNHATLNSIRTFLIDNRLVRWGFHGESELNFFGRNPEFARYFWSEFLPKQLKNPTSKNHFDKLLTKETLEKYYCIPTGSGMKKPSSVYDPADPILLRMIGVLEKQDEYLPTVSIPAEYSKGFATRLSPHDCLDYLNKNEKGLQEDRRRVCEWLANIPEQYRHSNFKNIAARFKETALWRNGEGNWVPLKDLYVLDKLAENKLIRDHFSGSKLVCALTSMPESNTNQYHFCQLIGITPLTKDLFDYNTIGNVREDVEEVKEIRKRLLYLSFIENPDGDWKEKYISRKEKLDKAKIEESDDIKYFYEGLSTTLYSLDLGEEGFAYRKGFKDQRFESRRDWIKNTFALTAFEDSVLDGVFLEPFISYVKSHYNGGALPAEFLECLSENDRNQLREEVVEEMPETPTQPYVSGATTPVNPNIPEDQCEDDEKSRDCKQVDSQNVSSGNNPKVHVNEHERNYPGCGPSDASTEEPKSNTADTDNVRGHNSHVDTSESNKKNEASSNNKLTDGSKPQNTDKSERKGKPAKKEKESFEERSQKKWEERKNAKITTPKSSQPTHSADEDIFDPEDKVDDTPNYGEVFDPTASNTNLRDDKPRKAQPMSSDDYDDSLESARQKADDEEEKRNRRVKLSHHDSPYSLEWFNYLIDMQLEAVKESKTTKRVLDLYDWKLMDKANNIYRLVSPSTFIPSNLAEASNVKMLMIVNGKKSVLDATILESDETGIDLQCKQYLSTPASNRWIRIEYANTGGFSQIQAQRFSQLANKFNLGTQLNEKLPEDITYIYGPPGTGKTTELVKRIKAALASNSKYNILVVTPTNRAADEIAERIANDSNMLEYLSRYGVTESRDLIRNYPDVLKNRQTMNLSNSSKNVMVTTIARYPYDTVQPYGDPIFDLKWDLIIVDEASMIDLVPITLLLVNNKAPKYIVAGDPKQIRPVKPSFDYPDEYVYNIYDMVNLNSFKEAKTRGDVVALDVQHRSVPAIGNLVSAFCYDGLLQNDSNKASAKALNLPGIKADAINVVGYEVIPMSHLYDFKSVDNSSVHVYSAIFAYEFATHIAKSMENNPRREHYTIGIVSPYKKQASAIQEMLSNRPVGNDFCSIKCGTVHKFQGGECDIMIVVMNYPDTHSGKNANINQINIMNVAMSRAKDYVFFLSPEKSKDVQANYPMNNELFRFLPKGFNFIHAHDIERVMFGDDIYIAKNASLKSHLPVNVSTPSEKHYEVRISDVALDIIINDDNSKSR